jgi:SOS response regulatory protein OraA/RecX
MPPRSIRSKSSSSASASERSAPVKRLARASGGSSGGVSGAKPTGTKRAGAAPVERVTALRAKARDPSLVDVVVDGASIGTALRSEVERLGLDEGTPLTATRKRALTRAFERARARTAALRALGRSDRSRRVLERELIERHGIAPAIAEEVVGELATDGWQDDGRFAARRAESLAERRGASAALIEATLSAEGIEAPLARKAAQKAVKKVAPKATECERASDIARELFGLRARRGGAGRSSGSSSAISTGAHSTGAAPTMAEARRVARQLAQRGYEADTILAALEANGCLIERDG